MVRSNTIVAIEDVKYVNASPIRLEGGGLVAANTCISSM